MGLGLGGGGGERGCHTPERSCWLVWRENVIMNVSFYFPYFLYSLFCNHKLIFLEERREIIKGAVSREFF